MEWTHRYHHEESQLHQSFHSTVCSPLPTEHQGHLVEYACTVWDPHTDNNIQKLDEVQRRSARFVINIILLTNQQCNINARNTPVVIFRGQTSQILSRIDVQDCSWLSGSTTIRATTDDVCSQMSHTPIHGTYARTQIYKHTSWYQDMDKFAAESSG